MKRPRRSPSTRLAGVLLLSGFLTMLAVAFTGGVPLPGGGPARTVTVAVTSTGDLVAGDAVRVDGVQVGRVAALDLDDSGRGARVRLELDEDVDVRRDARAALRWRTLLGGAMLVDLDPGTPSAPPLGDAVLPVARSSVQVELDDLVSVFAAPTPASLRTILDAGRRGLGDGPGVRALLRSAPRRLRTIARGTAPLTGRFAGDLAATVDAASRTTAALDRRRVALARLVEGAAGALGTTATHRSDLGTSIERLPAALTRANAMLDRLGTSLDRIDPLAEDLGPGLRALTASLPDARRTLRSVTRTAATARPVLDVLPVAAAGLGRAATATQRVLDGTDPIVGKVERDVLPWLESRDPRTKLRTYEAIGPTAGVAVHPEYDSGGFFLPFPADFGDSGSQDLAAATSGCLSLLGTPSAREQRRCRALARVFGGKLRITGGAR